MPERFIRPDLLRSIVLGMLTLLLGSCNQDNSPGTPASWSKDFAAGVGPATRPATTRPGDPPISNPDVLAERGFFTYPPAANLKSLEHQMSGSASCMTCHSGIGQKGGDGAPFHDSVSMHESAQAISCVDCHGGNAGAKVSESIALTPDSPEYAAAKAAAHVAKPKLPRLWDDPGNPEVSGAATLNEDLDYIRFVNPGDLRAAMVSCGECHGDTVSKVRTSMMAHGAMLWGAALYNNGAINRKTPVFGELYTLDGKPSGAIQRPGPTTQQADREGVLTSLWPLPRWEITQPGNPLRVFERGGKIRPEVGLPNPKEDSGRPDVKLSLRDFGTDVRTDPVFLGLQKTRLLDPTLNFPGTNDHPGDYRASGCSACHVVYANDRSPVHAGQMYARYGNRGESFSMDFAVNPAASPRAGPTSNPTSRPAVAGHDEKERWDEGRPARTAGQPIKHTMVRNMPTSQCITCHIHPGTNVVNAYLGFTWWDNETDGRAMYPKEQQYPDAAMRNAVARHNPEGSAARGLWSNMYPGLSDHHGVSAGPDFLEKLGTPQFNERLTRTQFADFHGHGWVYRAVFKQDRRGTMLDAGDNPVSGQGNSAVQKDFAKRMAQGVAFATTPAKTEDVANPRDAKLLHPPADVPVHMKDIHLERGMHCADCHFSDDSHGNGNLYGETRNAVHISCEDCHGSTDKPSPLIAFLEEKPVDLAALFTGNAAKKPLTDQEKKNRGLLVQRHFALDDTENLDAQTAVDANGESRPRVPRLFQKSALDSSKRWPVVQFHETVERVRTSEQKGDESWWMKENGPPKDLLAAKRPADVDRATMARYAHTVRKDGSWGDLPKPGEINDKPHLALAHSSSRMACYTCHTSWNTGCFGCHLPMKANERTPMLHNEGVLTRNYTNYNYQTIRDDVYMIGVDSSTKDNKIVPIRSACAVMVSSQDANRQWLYQQQQTVSAEGYSGTAFSPYFPHTVRATETKRCTDCHLSKDNDNNAIMAQLLLQGTNSVNFIGRFAWVASGKGGLEGIAVAERDEPQAVIGSTLHEIAYPDDYKKHVARKGELDTAHEHHGNVLDVHMRGEYVYTACGPDGFIAYDIANIDNKGFSERIVTAPVSPFGQRFFVKSRYATSITSPSTMAIDPTRPRLQLEQKLSDGTTRTIWPNEEGKITEIGDPWKVIDPNRLIHPLYAYLYLTDRDEGLIVIGNPPDSPNKAGVATLLDGNPENNFLERAVTFNPGGILKGARHLALHGTLAYVSCDVGLVIVDLGNPVKPEIVPQPDADVLGGLNGPRKVTFQFRYGFVVDKDGLKVLDVTNPRRPRVVRNGGNAPLTVPLFDARDVYVSRTYAYVAAGSEGLVIVDVENPEKPRRLHFPMDFSHDFNTRNGGINDANSVKVAMTNASMFAYVADGKNGLKVLQLTSPENTPTYLGFSPKPNPHLIASYKTHGPALAISEGLDRDRAVDEEGNQLSVFGRKGARPFTLSEMRRLYFQGEGPDRKLYRVSDVPDPRKDSRVKTDVTRAE